MEQAHYSEEKAWSSPSGVAYSNSEREKKKGIKAHFLNLVQIHFFFKLSVRSQACGCVK